MKEIIARGLYTILCNEDKVYSDSNEHDFTVNISDQLAASVKVNYENRSVETTFRVEVSDEFVAVLAEIEPNDIENVPQNLQEEVQTITKNLTLGTRQVLALLKYHLRHFKISEQLCSVREQTWSWNESDHKKFPCSIHFTMEDVSIEPLNNYSTMTMQAALTSKAEPLIAMRHLHRAKIESIPHHKWIDATIAAELAVKEVLSRVSPDIELLLMEMPSPPLTKLYGSILEYYLGERSPYLGVIRNGIEMRNKLVHRPSKIVIDGQEAINYVSDIEAAIFHLLSKLYPDDRLIYESWQRLKR